MKLLQRIRKAASMFMRGTLEPVANGFNALVRGVQEWAQGAWQRVQGKPDEDAAQDALLVAVVYACIRLVATDLAKLAPGVRRLTSAGVWVRDTHQALSRLIRRPNHFQTWFQFMFAWAASRLLAGDAFIVKLFQGMTLSEMIVLDPSRVTTLVARDTGKVFYRVAIEPLARITDEDIIVSSDDMMHSRYMPLGHPLLGTAPLDRAVVAARARGGILSNTAALNEATGVPPGILYVPEGKTEDQLKALADLWKGVPKGRIAVVDASFKFEALANKSVDSQSKELAELSGEDICIAFGVPPWKVGIGTTPPGDVESRQIAYYQDTLQWQKEDIEQTLDQGLEVDAGVYFELDPCSLYMMDSKGRSEVHKNLVGSGIMAPNEARMEWDLAPTKGGETPYLQQQNYALSALQARDQAAPAPTSAAPSPGGGAGQGPVTDSGTTDAPAASVPLLPWAGVWKADGAYPQNCFVTHKGGLWAKVGKYGDAAEPGTARHVWVLAVKRGEAPTEGV